MSTENFIVQSEVLKKSTQELISQFREYVTAQDTQTLFEAESLLYDIVDCIDEFQELCEANQNN